MSNSSLVSVKVPAYSGNYTVGRSGRKIEAICIHHMAGRLSAENCGKIFQAVGRNGSSHYGIGYDGKIGQYVDEKDTAWTNSNWDSNCKSVTIETSDNDNSWYVNDITLNSLIKLVADIARRNGLGKLVKGKSVTWHSMFTNTTCPGNYLLSKMDYIVDEANKINGYGTLRKKEISYQIWDDVKNCWLPNVINDRDYAGIYGHDVCCVYASSNSNDVTYKVHYKGGKWLPAVKNRTDYAGLYNKPIDGFMIKGVNSYRVHLRRTGKWLPWVTGYNEKDSNNGYAGILGQEIDAIQIK